MSIEMTPEPRRELILDMVSDLATDLLDYDRKEDEYLPRAAIEKGHRGRESTPEGIAGRLRDQLLYGSHVVGVERCGCCTILRGLGPKIPRL